MTNVQKLEAGDWICIALPNIDANRPYQITSVCDEFNYVTALINGESKIVTARSIMRRVSEPKLSNARLLAEIYGRITSLNERFDKVCEELNQLEQRISSTL
jgi:hypothetical protein